MALKFKVSVLETIFTSVGWAISLDDRPFQDSVAEWREEINTLIKWCDDNGLVNSNTTFSSIKGCYWQRNPYMLEMIIKRKDIFTLFNLTWLNASEFII